MTLYRDQVFENMYDQYSWPWQRSRELSNLDFKRCTFTSCALSVSNDPRRRTTCRNITLERCECNAIIYSAVFEDCMVDGLETSSALRAWYPVFKHVTLRGKIGDVRISYIAVPSNPSSREQLAFEEVNGQYYESVDWALDISAAEFSGADFRGVPGHLVRRDPETQVLIRREKILENGWKDVDLSGTYWETAIKLFIETTKMGSTVLVAPKRASNVTRLVAALHRLREAGIAEPD
jgi:hypothetical protein